MTEGNPNQKEFDRCHPVSQAPSLRVSASGLPAGPSSSTTVSQPRFVQHVFWTFAVRILMVVNSVVAGIIIARLLGVEGLGQLAVINVAVASVVQLGSAGLPSANTYFIAQDRSRLAPVAINSIMFAVIAGSLLGLGLGLVASVKPVWFGFVSPRLLTIAAISIPFQLITLIGLNIFLALGRIEAFNLVDLLAQAFVLINVVIALIAFKLDLPTLVSLNTAASVVIAVLILAMVTRHINRQLEGTVLRADGKLFGSMLRYGIKFHISILAGILIFRADLMVVNYFRGSSEAGVYSVASQVALMMMLLPGVIGTLLFPRVTANHDPSGEITSLVSRCTAFIMLLVCLAAYPLSLLLPLLYGEAFAGVTTQLWILLPGVFLIGVESVVAQHFSSVGLPKAVPVFWLITLVVNVALVLLLVPRFGGRGAAAASTLSYTLIFALIIFYYRKRTGTSLAEILFPKRHELRHLLRFAWPTEHNHLGT